MAVREAVRRRWRGTCSSRSRTTCDFEILRPRDSASMSATSGSGNRTVRLFMKQLYYISGRCARQPKETERYREVKEYYGRPTNECPARTRGADVGKIFGNPAPSIRCLRYGMLITSAMAEWRAPNSPLSTRCSTRRRSVSVELVLRECLAMGAHSRHGCGERLLSSLLLASVQAAGSPVAPW